MPFQSNGHKSLFVVLGANHIKDYMKRGFSDTRPCILHILPFATSTRVQTHAYNQAGLRLRVWLNAMWQTTHCNINFDSMPFTHRSLPMTRPFGECNDMTMTNSFFGYILSHHNKCSSLSLRKIGGWYLPLEVCILPDDYG